MGYENDTSVLFFADCVQVMGSYCDAIVMRHPETGAVQVEISSMVYIDDC